MHVTVFLTPLCIGRLPPSMEKVGLRKDGKFGVLTGLSRLSY